MIVDAELLLNYQRCSRRAFLDVAGDRSHRDAPNDYLQKLIQDSQQHQQSFLRKQDYHTPVYAPGDRTAAAAATVALMEQGVDRIAQGILLTETVEGVTLFSQPDLLLKQPGHSYFGDWVYVPTEIKLGKRPKLEYQIIAAFHTQVLAQVQGAWAETAWLMLREKGLYAVDLWEMLPRMQEILAECIQMLLRSQEPEVFISRSRCSLCQWFNYCYAIAKAEHHLSLLPGVTAARYGQLQALNLLTVKALAEATPNQLAPLAGFGSETAHKMIRQARSTLQNRAFSIGESSLALVHHQAGGRISTQSLAADLPSAPVELYFDIEAEPMQNLVYLHGVLVVDRLNKTETFYPLLAESAKDEGMIWQQFLDLVWQHPTAPIYHFCLFEAQTVERLAERYNTPRHLIAPLLTRFVDLHERVTRLVTLPVESYALKPIARWLGFSWRDPSANGAQAIYWYAQWLATGDRQYLQTIVDYNEDDCRATYHVKAWLVSFLQPIYQAELA
jgi:uncharacterized protein